RVTESDRHMSLVHDFIGGRGLGSRLLWDLAPAGVDPLAADSPLMFLTGPLTGLVPGGAHTAVVHKSPSTGITLGHAITGAQWGTELKTAGYDGVVVTGEASKPVYLSIEDGKAEVREAGDLWGKRTLETEVLLKQRLGDPRARVLCIGPAGENLVSFASIQQEYFRSAARGGCGTLMGAKRLKAIAVRGHGPIPLAQPELFAIRYEEILAKLRGSRTKRRGYGLVRWGSTISHDPHSDISELDVRNYREAYWADIDKIGGLEYERRCKVRSRSCFGCPICCLQTGVLREGPHAGTLTNPDFDSFGTIGPGCLVTDFAGANYLSALGDDLGMDDTSLGNVVGFAMECYERGLITKADTDGLELTWGNVAVMEALWHKVAYREGFGALLAQGVREVAATIGGGSEAFAMHAKGLSFAGYAPTAHPDRALQYAVGDRGGCHHYGLNLDEQNGRVWADSLTCCAWHRAMLSPADYTGLLSAATGWEYTVEDWDAIALRLLIMARAYNIREGMVPMRDDVLPARVHDDPLTQGPMKGAQYPREAFLKDRAEWYAVRGCDEAGYPTRETLDQLGLGFAASKQ
ncbi:MAG: aldehyde ferredoxin oxidoreductase family protein, partial [Chloroflexota bacterium]|nr:aldehyde ferredoxin oxidoreductase family protein [Chloroflexota bacterium]